MQPPREEAWKAAYRLLEQTEVTNQLKAWVQPLELNRVEENDKQHIFHFQARNAFSVNWVKDQFLAKMQNALQQVTGLSCEVRIEPAPQSENKDEVNAFSLEGGPLAPPRELQRSSNGTVLKSGRGTPPSLSSRRETARKIGLDERFRFENFIVGASNQFSHASALSVAENPGGQYNPLFIYSPPGLGKTHLHHAIGNHILSKSPNTRVAYLSAETFVNELIESLQHHKMSKFRQEYRETYDVLLIDDIQFIAGKKSTEEEFFHTFNALYGDKRQIVVTSDRPPKEIEKLEERIRTRFEWGLVADIQPPEIETRIAILKSKAERDDIYLPDDVATFLAAHIKNNVRELEGVLIRLQARASLTGAEISLEMAKHELRNIIADEEEEISVEAIQTVVARHFGLKVQDLKSSARNKTVALPRQIAMFLARKYMRLGFKDIGASFGGKDHTTIMHACAKIERSYESSGEIREAVESIQNKL